jgi:hypothetical protein
MIKYSDLLFARMQFNFVSSNKTIDQINSSHMLVVFTNYGWTVNLDRLFSRKRWHQMYQFIVLSKCGTHFHSIDVCHSFVWVSSQLCFNRFFIWQRRFGNLLGRTVPTTWNHFLFNYDVLRPVAATCSNCQRKSYGSDLTARISSDKWQC